MKILLFQNFVFLLIGIATAFTSCHTAHSNAFYDGGSNKKNNSGNRVSPGALDGVYIQNQVPTKKVVPYEHLTNSGSASLGRPGVLTGGETNDLGKWNLWNDMVKESLDEQILLWKIHPYHRYAVLLQTTDGMPVQGARVSLYNSNKEILWQAITDNTGSAQLWAGLFNHSTDTIAHAIQIEYKGISDQIANPLTFFEGVNTKTLDIPYLKPNQVDIAFVVDATASMVDEINFLKAELNDIISKTTTRYSDIELNIGSLFYRCVGNTYTTRIFPLTDKLAEVMNFISYQEASEGGTESVEIALDETINLMNWRTDARTRLIFIVLDEPSGYTDEVIQKIHLQFQTAAKKGIKIIPIVASGSGNPDVHDRNLEFLMRCGAVVTNGSYLFITDDSGIGGAHTTPIIDHFEVQLLNDLIVNTIEKNIYMPDKVVSAQEADTLEVNNANSLTTALLTEMSKNLSDSALIKTLLPYTAYTSYDELSRALPITEFDTTAFLTDQNQDVHWLKIYPNPTNGLIKIEFNFSTEWLYLTDLSGKIISRVAVNQLNLVELDLFEYPSGIYFIKAFVNDEWISAKIILQK